MKTNFEKILLSLLISLACGHAWSQTAANWNFNNTLNATSGTNITAASAVLSSKTAGSFNSASEYYGEGGWPAGSIDTSVYLQFQVNPTTANTLSLNSVTITLRRSTTGTAAGSGPMQWSLRSSLDNYATDITTGSLTTSYVATVVPLPAAFQSLPSPVTFHLYGYNMVVTTGGNNRFVWDNISIQGQANPIILAEKNISLQAKALKGGSGSQTGTGSQSGGSVQLDWKTTGFDAGTELTLERSTDGENFSAIDRQQTVSAADTDQRYEDVSLPSSSHIYYRISASEPQGQIYHSAIASIQQDAGEGMQILGFIGQGTGAAVKALVNISEEGQYQLVLMTIDGKTISRRMINPVAGRSAMDLDLGNYPHGVYVLTLIKGGNSTSATSRQFIN